MAVVSASEAKQGLASIIEVAACEPVAIQRHERDVAVLMSAEEYRRLIGRLLNPSGVPAKAVDAGLDSVPRCSRR